MIKYQWKGRRYNPVAGTYSPYVTLSPIYGDKLSIKHSMPDDERYYKESFNGTLMFVREDFFWIMSKIALATRFEVVYELELHAIEDNTDQLVTTLKFTITDCEIDEDNGIAKVKPTTKTRYDEVLDGLDREFNLVELNPVIEELTWSRRALLQFTEEGSDVVTNCLGGMTWEQDKTNASGDLINDYKFGVCNQFIVATVTDNGNGIYYGDFEPMPSSGDVLRDFDVLRGVINPTSTYGYKLHFYETLVDVDTYMYQVQLYRSPFPGSSNYTLYASSRAYSTRIPDLGSNIALYNSNDQQVSTVSWRTPKLYARILCDTYVTGAYTRPSSDIITNDNNYRYVKPYKDSIAIITNNGVTTPTPYGQYTTGYFTGYYAPPASVGYMPIMQSYWASGISMWVDLSLMPNLDLMFRSIRLRHAYPLYSAIKVLLAQIAPNISFNNTTDYSQFLFDYGRSHPVVDYMPYLFITPKTNILKGDYKTPAYNAPIKLKDILEMLRQVYKCYWFIDDSNRFRIEHVSWFMNGGTYSTPSPVVSYNLTTMFNSRNGKRWSMDTQHYTFDKPNMPNTYTFGWMDEVSQEFEGYQMEMSSCFVEKGKNEEISVSKFTTDIDFVTITPDDISKDGFMLLGATLYNSQYVLPLYEYQLPGSSISFYIQNGYLAFVYLEKTAIWLTDLPARSVSYADGTTASVVKQSRLRQQDVTVPMATPIFNPMTLIQSSIGAGEVKDIEINLSSLTAKAKLHHDIQ